MIRKAQKEDTNQIIEMLKHYRENSPLDILKKTNDENYIYLMINYILQDHGFIYVAEENNKLIGMIISAIVPNIWNQQIKQCSELAYWVEPEYRGGTIAYRLIKSYLSECEELKKIGKIDFYTISKMVNSPDLNYQKFGFKQLEETWVQ